MNDSHVDPLEYHIEATESLVDRPLRTIKHGNLFAIFDQQGNFHGGADGLFYRDTRFLSRYQLSLAGVPPLHLGAMVHDDNAALVVDLTNADVRERGSRIAWLQRDSIHLSRLKFIRDHVAYERIRLRSYNPIGRPVEVALSFEGDFADLFEVRGATRERRGRREVEVGESSVTLRYHGLDDVERRTVLRFDPPPDRIDGRGVAWDVDFDEQRERTLGVELECRIEPEKATAAPLTEALRTKQEERRTAGEDRPDVESSNADFDHLVRRSWADLDMLATETEHGLYPYAGIPWYSTVFGRDGIVTAMQTLWLWPRLARGVLNTLAATQATQFDPEADAEPGKILHETRSGEMANLGEVPFRRYYGTVDATPLFVWLAAQYFERTGDLDTIRAIWPNIRAALGWMDAHGDPDGDGFIEYQRQRDEGLSNQGWKDSADAIFHADGRLANGPIALCEVQGYAYAARLGAADLAERMGDETLAERLRSQAEELRKKFERDFWIEEAGFYALALDGRKKPCRTLSSNAGQVLATGIAAPDRAKRVAERLMGDSFFTGWGIRTIALSEARYNPMSYHNGSIWPHDNSLIAMGFARYGIRDAGARLLSCAMDVARYDECRRLPELFCGFRREAGRGPTAYPVACSPQAWAAAAPLAMLGASLGLRIDALGDRIRLERPALPEFLDAVTIHGLEVAGSSLDLRFARTGSDVTCSVERRSGRTEVIVSK